MVALVELNVNTLARAHSVLAALTLYCSSIFVQGTPLPGKELCDTNAVPGSASAPSSSGVVGEKRQSEVSQHSCYFVMSPLHFWRCRKWGEPFSLCSCTTV